jgi:hypothetical protein
VVIDEDELVNAVRTPNAAGKLARADTVRIELGAIADDGGHWELATIAGDLAELESLGNSNALLPLSGRASSRRQKRAPRP